MAYHAGQRDTHEGFLRVPDLTKLLTIDGYRQLYEKCEGSSDIVSRQALLYKAYDAQNWMNMLSSMKFTDSVDCLFRLSEKLSQNAKFTKYSGYITLIQFYSLLENVFRNVLLRPYIPAYRTINTDCGRYRSFIQRYESSMPFAELHFQSTASNLLTYQGTDREQTIRYALTCSILCQYYTKALSQTSRNPTVSEV